ncbi:hypothetical protein [Cryptosporangium arvum]|uniref:hypothetical protein n=1 Tax=Cryptosporangium arvum TaxID=80871 RepID=UPI0012EDDACD|nr:hypothetical protein [Cryptosporangium arvum]
MREHSAGGATGGRIAVVGLFAALAGGLLWAPAADAASDRATGTGDAGVVRPETVPVLGSSWTLRRSGEVTVTVTVAPDHDNDSGSGDADMADGSS